MDAQNTDRKSVRTENPSKKDDADPAKVRVCILDSGCNDPEAKGKNYVGDSDNLSDSVNHGTCIYRIIQTLSPGADLYMLKCLESEGELTEAAGTSTTEEAISRAIYDAVDVYRADIINMSWTLNTDSTRLHRAVRYASEHDAVLIAAVGNLSYRTPLGSLTYPAAWDEVIGVSGADLDDQGRPVESLSYLHNESVYVSADGSCPYENCREESGEKGSSYAAARVTGILAQHGLVQQDPEDSELSEADAKDRDTEKSRLRQAQDYLRSIAEEEGDPGYDPVYGWGFISSTL